jgi:hypothetical protein
MLMTTVAFKISFQLANSPSKEGVAQLKADMKRYLSHMLDVAQIDGAQVEKSDLSVVASEREIAGLSRAIRGG